MAETYSFFDDDLDNLSPNKPKQPLWAMDLDDPKNEKAIIDWLHGELSWLQDDRRDRDRKTQRNLALYKGIQYQSQEARSDRERTNNDSTKVSKIVINHLADLTMNRVSRLIKFKPAVAVLPANDEFSDKNAAKSVKSLLDHVWYNHNFEGTMTVEYARNASVMGESYLFILWDPHKGDLHPSYRTLSKKGKVPLLDEDGKPQVDDAGNTIYLDQPVRVGDVDYQIVLSTEVWPEKKQRWSDVNYIFKRNVCSPDELRSMFRDKAGQIKETGGARIYDYEKMELRDGRNEVVWFEFWHKRTDFMDKGRYVAWTGDTLLANKEFPFSHRWLPCVRFTDHDLPGELYGDSFFERVKPIVSTYNNLTNLILRNQYLVAHPKWMYPAGSVNRIQLANDITMVEYKGPTPPVLVQSNPTPNEMFQFREQLKEEFQQLSGVFGVSRGEPPPGIKAGVALQFLSEQEQERFNELVLKYNEAVRQIAIMTIAVAGDYYDSSDDRMVRVLGKNNEWRTIFFDAANLSKDYDVRVQNSSALPETKAARIQTLMDLNREFPGQVDPSQLLDMIDMGNTEKYVSTATVNVRQAEAENELLLNGEMDVAISDPKEWEDHVTHWKTHMRAIQEYAFKYFTPKEVQERMIDHVRATEMLMLEKAKTNQLMAQAVATLPQFPVFYVEPVGINTQSLDNAMPPEMAGQQLAASGAELPQESQPMSPEEQLAVNPSGPSVLDQMQGEPAVPVGVGPITPGEGV